MSTNAQMFFSLAQFVQTTHFIHENPKTQISLLCKDLSKYKKKYKNTWIKVIKLNQNPKFVHSKTSNRKSVAAMFWILENIKCFHIHLILSEFHYHVSNTVKWSHILQMNEPLPLPSAICHQGSSVLSGYGSTNDSLESMFFHFKNKIK